MDERPDARPPGLSVTPAGGPPEPPRKVHRRRSHALALLAGLILVGAAAAAAVAVVMIARGDDDESAPAPVVSDTGVAPAEPVLRVIFPEGFTRVQMAERIGAVNVIAEEERGITPALSAEDYRKATNRKALDTLKPQLPSAFAQDKKVKRLEGFLFPATYDFFEDTTSPELADDQLAKFAETWAQIDLAEAEKKNLTAYDVLIIASMIEGEVQVAKERALVAAVIYNRLKLDMPLGIDATIRYGLGIPPDRAIRQSELDDPNPYNTRIHAGLPPTPINNPGLASMQAAAHPDDVDYLYFVRTEDCKTHFFTASEAEFLEYLEGPRC